MAVLDADGRITEINGALSDWLEQSPAGLAGANFWDELEKALPGCKESAAKARPRLRAFRAVRGAVHHPPVHSEQSLWFVLGAARGADRELLCG